MRPRATRQSDWAQLGIGACALLLPPLALGGALYSMLAPPDDGETRPAGAEAVLPDDRQPAQPAGLTTTTTAAGGPGAGPAGLSAEGRAQVPDQPPAQGAPVQVAPVQIITMPAVAVNPPAYAAEGAAGPPPAESPPAAAAPKRSIPHRNAQRQPQQQDFLKTWLQQIGLLPPYH
jgi:hypothetical protein